MELRSRQREEFRERDGSNRGGSSRSHRHRDLADHGALVEVRDAAAPRDHLHLAVRHEVHLVSDVSLSDDDLSGRVDFPNESFDDELHETLVGVAEERDGVEDVAHAPQLHLDANVVAEVAQEFILRVEERPRAFIVEKLANLDAQRQRDVPKLEVLVRPVHEPLKLHVRGVEVGDELRHLRESVQKHARTRQLGAHREQPLVAITRHHVAVPDRRHGGDGPVHARHVLRESRFEIQTRPALAVGERLDPRDPAVAAIFQHVQQKPRARLPVRQARHRERELDHLPQPVLDAQPALQSVQDAIQSEHAEQFDQSHQFGDANEFGASVGAPRGPLFVRGEDEVEGDARDDVQRHPRRGVVPRYAPGFEDHPRTVVGRVPRDVVETDVEDETRVGDAIQRVDGRTLVVGDFEPDHEGYHERDVQETDDHEEVPVSTESREGVDDPPVVAGEHLGDPRVVGEVDVLGGDGLAEVQNVAEPAEERDAGVETDCETGVGARESLLLAELIDALGTPGFGPVEAGEGGGGDGGARAFRVGFDIHRRADWERAAERAGDAAADGTLLVGVRAVAGSADETGGTPTGDVLGSRRVEAPRGGRGERGRGATS